MLACAVESEPSCPVFMACNMSRASAPRTSPTMMRSGRMRRALRSSSRTDTAPLPSTLGGRASRATTCGLPNRSSAASSMVMRRSSSGMQPASTFSSVVFPELVPPETTMLRLPCTHACKNTSMRSSSIPPTSKSVGVSGTNENRRTVSVGPQSERGGRIACTLLPSASRASTYGDDPSTRRPSGATILSITCITSSSPSNTTSCTLSSRPFRSTYMSSGPFTMTSVTSGSRSKASIGPSPTTWSAMSLTARVSAACGNNVPSSRSKASAWSRTCNRRSARVRIDRASRSVRSRSRACRRRRTSIAPPSIMLRPRVER